jgi:hypothetical protein
MKNSNKYQQLHIHISDHMAQAVRVECFNLRISRQNFIRALIRDYFIRNKGIDLDLQKSEPINVKGGNG